MKAADRPRLGKGVRLRRESDGSAMLFVPEGVLQLNDSAAATLELVNGVHTVAEIAARLIEHFDVGEDQARDGVCKLLERLAERRFVEIA